MARTQSANVGVMLRCHLQRVTDAAATMAMTFGTAAACIRLLHPARAGPKTNRDAWDVAGSDRVRHGPAVYAVCGATRTSANV